MMARLRSIRRSPAAVIAVSYCAGAYDQLNACGFAVVLPASARIALVRKHFAKQLLQLRYGCAVISIAGAVILSNPAPVIDDEMQLEAEEPID